nr:MAG TPA: hypothetical protein [Bacteriophage sp.]
MGDEATASAGALQPSGIDWTDGMPSGSYVW